MLYIRLKMTGLARFLTLGCIFLLCVERAVGGEAYEWSTVTAGLWAPSDVVVDSAGNVYFTEYNHYAVRKAALSGATWAVTTLAGSLTLSGNKDGTNGSARFSSLTAVAVDGSGCLFVGDTGNGAVKRVAPVGTNWVVTSFLGITNFVSPYAIQVDAATNIYVAEYDRNWIRKASQVGTNWVLSIAAGSGAYGSADGTNRTAQFHGPAGLAMDSAGSLYVADAFNYTIRKMTAYGTNWVVTTVAGLPGVKGSADGTNSDARFGFPVGVAVDCQGKLYVGDAQNNTIRLLRLVGTNWVVSTIGGLAGVAGYADGIGASARFYFPTAVKVDAAGNLFVTDSENNALRIGQKGFALDATFSQGRLALSWPLSASNYVLETASSLAPAASWMAITNGIAASGDTFTLTNDAHGTAFYRLHRQ
jgi:hypothetical protein